jgi:hypothetical protein
MKFYKRPLFWNNVKNTFGVVGSISQLAALGFHLDESWNMWIAIATLAGMLVGIWFQDTNKNNVIDVFEDEEVTKVEMEITKKPGEDAKAEIINVENKTE